MIKTYLKTTFRHLAKNKIYSLINILGLSIGISCTILILLWVQDELNYDRFHKNSNTLYRIIHYKGNFNEKAAGTPAPLGPAMKNELPEVVAMTRIAATDPRMVIKYGDKKFYETRVVFADPELFDMFSYPFLQGNRAAVFSDPANIILTKAMAEKYFGNENPLGKTLSIEDKGDVVVSGVIKTIPHNSHIQFDFLLPFQRIITDQYLNIGWGDFNFNTYVQLKGTATPSDLNQKVTDLAKAHDCPQILQLKRKFALQPLKEVHLDADTQIAGIEVMAELGDKTNVYVFLLIAFLILFIACINFVNLSTARSSKRKMEVGMRKVMGANRMQLIQQFLSESLAMAMISFVIATCFIWLLFPLFNTLTGKHLSFSIANSHYLLEVLGLSVLTGLLAGLYPAFYLSSFNPMAIFKKQTWLSAGGGKNRPGQTSHSRYRKIMVVGQFSISIALIIGSLLIHEQLQFVRNRNLGFDKENIVLVPIRENFRTQYEFMKFKLLQVPSITGVTAQEWLQLRGVHNTHGLAFDWGENGGKDHSLPISHTRVDYDFIPIMGIVMAEGRNFSKDFPSDAQDAFILNEEAVSVMGMKAPIGQKFRLFGKVGKIVGVMKNTNFSSLHHKTEPQVYHVLTDATGSQAFGSLFVKISGSQIKESLGSLERIWKSENPNSPFEFQFLDDAINAQYKSDQRVGKTFNYFTILAIFISCLGLFGLSSFMTEQRTKEIGIRKVLGASSPGIVALLSKEFIKWVGMANILTWPIAYFLMNRWLLDFAYRIEITIWPFIFSGLFAIAIALLTVGYQAIKAANANPVISLKYE